MKAARCTVATTFAVIVLIGVTGVASAQTETPAQSDAVAGPGEEWILYQWLSP